MKTTTIYALVVLCAVMVASAAAHGSRRGGDREQPSLPESWQNVMTECEEQAKALCGPPEDRPETERRLAGPSRGGRGGSRSGRGREEQGPHPGRVALCVSDHDGEFTGSCATAISAVSEEEMTAMLEQAQQGLTPAAHFKRACAEDVTGTCSDSSDVLACLSDNVDDLQQQCAEELQRVEQLRADMEAHHRPRGHHGEQEEEHDEDEDEESSSGMDEDEDEDELDGKQRPLQWSNSESSVPSTLSPAAFNSIDGYEQQQGDDEPRRKGLGVMGIAVIGVAAVAFIALVAGVVVVVRRRRAARRVSVPRFSPMDSSDSIEVITGEAVAASSDDVPIAAKV